MAKIFVGGCEYKYTEVPKAKIRGVEYAGFVNFPKREIIISKDLGTHQLITIVHESIHAIAHEYTTNKPLAALDEESVGVLANGIVGVLRQLKKVKN